MTCLLMCDECGLSWRIEGSDWEVDCCPGCNDAAGVVLIDEFEEL